MPCDTRVEVRIDDKEIEKEARKKLGLPESGSLTRQQAAALTKEAGILKTIKTTRRLAPTAVIKRSGDKLTISVNM